MKKLLTIIPLVFLLCFAFSFQRGEEVAEGPATSNLTIDSEINELLETDREWAKAAQSDDIERIFYFWTEDAVLYNVFRSGKRVVGKDAIREFVTKSRSQPGRSLKWIPLEAFVTASADVGCTRGTYEVVFPGEDGNLVALNGEYFNTWKKLENGQWKCAIETQY